MKIKKLGLLLVLVLLVSNVTVHAETEKGYYDYEGTVGKAKVAMSLYVDNNTVKGSYLFNKYRKIINLDGKISNNQITLNEYDADNKVSGKFVGKLQKDDSIQGAWKNIKTGAETPFKLTLTSIITSEYGQRYSIVGIDDNSVNQFVEQLQKYVIKDNKNKIADMVSYPIEVYINKKAITIHNKREFIKNYSQVINGKLKEALSTAYTSYMFVNYQGIMFGSNGFNVWINGIVGSNSDIQLKIISFNN